MEAQSRDWPSSLVTPDSLLITAIKAIEDPGARP